MALHYLLLLAGEGGADEDFTPSAAFCRALEKEEEYDDNDAIAMGGSLRGLNDADSDARPAADTEVRRGAPAHTIMLWLSAACLLDRARRPYVMHQEPGTLLADACVGPGRQCVCAADPAAAGGRRQCSA